ncbi:unnamed protein product [Alopecurus aequalis]
MAVISRARAYIPSPSSSPLPALSPRSPQTKVERMFTREGSGRSSHASGTSRSASLRHIGEEATISEEDSDGRGKLYVAVGKDVKDGKSNLLWAARNLLANDLKLVLLHIHQPAERIMNGLCKVSASQLEEKELKAYRTIEKEEMNTLLNQYLSFCRVSLKVQAEPLVIDKNSPANGIIELIDQRRITKLVMGTSSVSVKRKVPKSKIAAIVHLQSKPYCQIFYICKEVLACPREATQLSANAESPQSSCASSVSDQPEFPPRSLSLPPGHSGFLGSTDHQALQRRSNSISYPLPGLVSDSVGNMSAARRQSIDMKPIGFSPNSSQQIAGGSPSDLKDLDSMDDSPIPISVASSEEHQHSMVESVIQNEVFEQLHQVRNELERSRKEAIEGRQKAQRDLFEASMMFKARENSLCKEKKGVVLTEFSYNEVKEATNNFDECKKIGHGGCGSVYKGFLRHTTVAIKKFNREGTAGEKEFNDEVETLCRMRHPNLVTLIGVCREAKVLVFEFLSNGSLEDCLQCKHQTKPLSWRMRIRIAADICTGLIFLHSNKPKGIAHGDLKPDNVLLDSSFVCKLADFGISRPLNLTNTTVTPYHRTNQIKGTMGYVDPGYIASGELTAQYDVYSFGVVLMRLLTGKSLLGLPNEVEAALSNDMLQDIIDTSAGEWPPEYTEELARLAMRCCRYERKERPDLGKEAWGVLQAMMNCPDDKCQPPTFFICPMTQEIMRDPHIAADGFTYEGEAIKDWLQRGHKMSPMTYLSFTHHELIPNNALRFAIQEWEMQQQP